MLLLKLRRKGESKELVERLLGDTVKCYTTLCVQRELKKLGKEFAGGCGNAFHDTAAALMLQHWRPYHELRPHRDPPTLQAPVNC